MVTYVVGDPEHQVDHPPLFACREHKNLLRLSARFVDELLSAAQDVMPGNPDEIATAFLREAGPAYRLPEFLIPPKLFLFNPRGLRGAEALPYTVVLVDRKFFGIPARYLTQDRFDGCEECAEELTHRRPPPLAVAARPAPARPAGHRPGQESGVRRMPAPGARLSESGATRRPPGLNESGALRRPPGLNESGATRRPPDLRRGPPSPPTPPPGGGAGRPASGPPRPASRPPGGPGRPAPRPPQQG